MKNAIIGFDLCEKLDVIPFDKFTAFFNQHLNEENRNKTTKVIETSSAKTNV